jgi:hypothetical protein
MPPLEIGRHHQKRKHYFVAPLDRRDNRESPVELPDGDDLWQPEVDEPSADSHAELERRIAVIRERKQELGRNLRQGELEEIDKLL